MEIRSLSVIRFAKDIPFTKQRGKSPIETESMFIEYGKRNGLIYCGLVGEYKGAGRTKALMKCAVLSHKPYTALMGVVKSGSGCMECGRRKTSSGLRTNEAVVVHSINKECDKRGDVKFIEFIGGYKTTKTRNLKCECLLGHGEYITNRDKFMQGQGCPACGVSRRSIKNTMSYETAIAMIDDVCNSTGTLQFLMFVGGYKGSTEENLMMRCTLHDDEFKTSVNRLCNYGQGCPVCGIKRRAESHRLTETEAINNVSRECARSAKYKNPVFVGGYINSQTRNLRIDCCGCEEAFMSTYSSFMSGVGCPQCISCGFNRSKPGYVYIQKITGEVNVGKIGITNKTPEERMRQHARSSTLNHELIFSKFINDGNKVWEIERLVKSTLKDKMRFVPRELMEDGHTETFPIELLTPVLNEVKSICMK